MSKEVAICPGCRNLVEECNASTLECVEARPARWPEWVDAEDFFRQCQAEVIKKGSTSQMAGS